ncbi:MAG: monovalent cation:proton antiporter-2 (CPA2) family protein, partial [Proteobacteria bacterium]|nr:monovalent cation:proton antiporter-2 (CPA2) family protein [Pseudomonadota bacterium]
AAVVSVPLAKRLGLGSVLGYLLAGIAIGPFGLELLGDEVQDVMHFAEFGVVMMLFLVGLELEPSLLWRLRTPIVGLGGLQVGLTGALIAGVALAFGLHWKQGVAIGMVLALSSTAIVLQTLQEKGLMKSAAGQSAFAVLLFQDIAVIPMLALFPLLATRTQQATPGGHHASSWLEQLAPWMQTLIVLGAVSAVVVGGHYAVRPAFRFIARTRLREIFVAGALLLVIGIALLMAQVGLSPALGTFVAGVVLADSEYRHELESDIEPFKGLLLGLFFLAVGASIDFERFVADPVLIGGLVVSLMLGKLLVLALLARLFRLGIGQNLLFSFAMAQGGEFAFVLLSAARQGGVLGDEISDPLVLVVAMSMALTPLNMILFDKVIRPRVGARTRAPDYDAIHGDNPVIVAGFGRFGQICTRLLDAQGIASTVLEYDSDQVETLRRFGRKVYYGDASRLDLLTNAGAEHAKVLILALDRPEKTLELVRTAKKHFPQLAILARAHGRVDAYDLVQAGVEHVFRETFESAIAMGVRGLELLGHRAYRARRVAARFRKLDEALVRSLAGSHRDDDFVHQVRRAATEAEAILRTDLERGQQSVDHGWDTESLVAEFGDGSSGKARSELHE